MKSIIKTDQAPAPIGPYNQAVMAGNVLYTSGQIAMDPESGELVMENIQKESHRVMKNLKAVLEAAEMNFENVVKTSIFLKDMDDFKSVNAVYAEYFSENNAAARETVQVVRLPKDVNVEISMIAIK